MRIKYGVPVNGVYKLIGKRVNDRVFLREMIIDDWVDLHKYASKEIVCKYQPWGPNTEDESLEFVKLIIEDAIQVPRTRYVFAVIEKENNEMIGSGEINIREMANREGEIAYIIHPDFWGRGYATEVAKLLIHFGFTELSLHRIYATCDPRNIPSAKVLEKLGMVKEGRLRENLLIRDGWRDSFVFGLLESEWS